MVAWSLKPESNDNAWRRWASRSVTTGAALQDSWFASQQLMGSEPGQLRNRRGVSQWQVYFRRATAWQRAVDRQRRRAPAGATSVRCRTMRCPQACAWCSVRAGQRPLSGTLTRDIMLGP